jgi:tricorn protease interacting factor F2/3
VGSGNPLFNRIVASIALIADDSMEKDIKRFFKSNPTPGTERVQAQTIERIRIRSKFLRNMEKEFKN